MQSHTVISYAGMDIIRYNRLCSIVDDATFVMKVADIMPSLALIGELILFNAKLYIFSINEKSQQQMSVVDLGTLIAQR